MHFTSPGKRSIRWRCRYKEQPRIFGIELDFAGFRDGDVLEEVLAGLKKHVRARGIQND